MSEPRLCKNPTCYLPLRPDVHRNTKFCDKECSAEYRALKLVAPALVKVGTEVAIKILCSLAGV